MGVLGSLIELYWVGLNLFLYDIYTQIIGFDLYKNHKFVIQKQE